jgi:hypothetical protein
MEIKQNVRRDPSAAVVFLFVILTAVALGLVGWHGLAAGIGPAGPTVSPQASTTGFPGPDAKDRNAQLLQNQYAQLLQNQYPQLQRDETTHGH